jgi:predicted type IV restriction endonuclease
LVGYKELEEIRTEFRIRGEYADYVVQLKRKKHFVVEVKSIQLDLHDKHLRQSINYAANEGIDWILLMNGRQIELYRVNFGKPISCTLIYSIDLLDKESFKDCHEQIWYLTKRAVERDELEEFWKRSNVLQPENLVKLIYSEEIVKRLRNDLKTDTGIYFQLDDVAASLYDAITQKVDFPRPRLRSKK